MNRDVMSPVISAFLTSVSVLKLVSEPEAMELTAVDSRFRVDSSLKALKDVGNAPAIGT